MLSSYLIFFFSFFIQYSLAGYTYGEPNILLIPFKYVLSMHDVLCFIYSFTLMQLIIFVRCLLWLWLQITIAFVYCCYMYQLSPCTFCMLFTRYVSILISHLLFLRLPHFHYVLVLVLKSSALFMGVKLVLTSIFIYFNLLLSCVLFNLSRSLILHPPNYKPSLVIVKVCDRMLDSHPTYS